MPNTQSIQAALAKLLTRSGDDAYVIIEHRKDGNFVQFVVGEDKSLILDLPSHNLAKPELERVRTLFQALAAEGYNVHSEGQPEVFQARLGDDAATAAAIAVRVMIEVYGCTADFPLAIEEN